MAILECPQCNTIAVRVGKYWACPVHDQYRVGIHKDSGEPLGELADASTRMARIDAHNVFDKMWKSKGWGRTSAYRWLAKEMKLPEDKAHIAMFNESQCKRLIRLCESPSREVLKRIRFKNTSNGGVLRLQLGEVEHSVLFRKGDSQKIIKRRLGKLIKVIGKK